MKRPYLSFFVYILLLASCKDQIEAPSLPLPEATITVAGKSVIKVLPRLGGWMILQETLQPQYLITQPNREISWRTENFSERSRYQSPEGWSLIDAVVHPSGQVSAVSINVDLQRSYSLEIKMLRFIAEGVVVEQQIHPIPLPDPQTLYFPVSLDRIHLIPFGEDVYVVARWAQNEVQAYRLSFEDNQFQVDWETVVEPPSFEAAVGIIGGGFDNFHQGNRLIFVYSGVDSHGNLYVAIPSSQELLSAHDAWFHENLSAGADPGTYDFGVAILTQFSAQGERKYSKLEGQSRFKHLLNMRVSDQGIYLLGRIKTGMEPNSWDAWVLSADGTNGNVIYESNVDIKDGDMFWDLDPLPGGGALAVGTTNYTQNPSGLSVSDARTASAVVLDPQGKVVREIALPQGPSERGSEALFVSVLQNGSAVFAGVHNAPGTHADVYCDGFVAVRDFSMQH